MDALRPYSTIIEIDLRSFVYRDLSGSYQILCPVKIQSSCADPDAIGSRIDAVPDRRFCGTVHKSRICDHRILKHIRNYGCFLQCHIRIADLNICLDLAIESGIIHIYYLQSLQHDTACRCFHRIIAICAGHTDNIGRPCVFHSHACPVHLYEITVQISQDSLRIHMAGGIIGFFFA